MFHAISNKIDVVNTEYQSIQDKGVVRYVFDKIQDRNPLHSPIEYRKEYKGLKKRIIILKQIKKRSNILWKERKDFAMKDRAVKLDKRIQELEAKLLHIYYGDRGQTLLKCAAPCNLIIPGTGDIFRIAAYSIKFISAVSYWIKKGNLDEVKRVAEAATLATITAEASQCVYAYFKDLKECLTFSNFKALFNY